MRKGAKKDLLKTFRGKDDFFTKPARAGAVAVLLVEGHKSRAVRRTEGGREGAARREQKRVDPEGTTEEQLQSSLLFSALSDGNTLRVKEREREREKFELGLPPSSRGQPRANCRQ